MTNFLFKASALLLICAAPLFAGDGHDHSATEMAKPADGNVFFTDQAGRHALDPVCSMHVLVNDKTPSASHDGKTWYFCNAGCAKSFSAKPAETLANFGLPANIIAMSGSKMMANCAVSNERMAVTDKSAHQVYKGRDYYFCCDKCPKAFAKNPEKFVTAVAAAEEKFKKDFEAKQSSH